MTNKKQPPSKPESELDEILKRLIEIQTDQITILEHLKMINLNITGSRVAWPNIITKEK